MTQRGDATTRHIGRTKPRLAEPTAADVCRNFDPARLIQARHLAMLSRHELANKIGVPAWRLGHWETGTATPKAYELERVAETTGQIVPFFQRGRPMAHISESDCHFRPCAYGR